jgi:CO/xanthine dehydrogenase Mo-binding subunit
LADFVGLVAPDPSTARRGLAALAAIWKEVAGQPSNATLFESAGAGETPIVGIAPALAAAIFGATGERRRGLPLAPEK